MERLNALGSSLPPEQPPTNQVIESLNSELSQEFKLAANAVTKLYRVANERNSLLKHQGYLQCLDDILSILGQNSSVSLDVVRLWCLKQRNDMLSHGTGAAGDNTSETTNSNQFDFNFDSPKTAKNSSSDNGMPKFRLSKPPPSVEHTAMTYKPKKTRCIKRQPLWTTKQGKLPREGDGVEEVERSPRYKFNHSSSIVHAHPHVHHHHYYTGTSDNDSIGLDRPKTRMGTEIAFGQKKKQRLNKKDSLGD